MDDQTFGKRDKRGNWAPNGALSPAPLFVLPPRPLQLLRWLPSYFLPWNVFFMATAALFWFYLTPETETTKTLSVGWIAFIFARNLAAFFLFYGVIEFRLYRLRRQENRFKYNPNFPADKKNSVFMFGSQALDSIIRAVGTGVTIWTAIEVVTLWAFANNYVPMANFHDDPLWLATIVLLVPVFHEAYFFAIHRALHIPFLYKMVHSVHHNSVNPSPWSSLAMHPIEHLFFFGEALIHLVIFSHPLVAIYNLHSLAFGAVVGHVGFDKIETGEDSGIDTHAYAHYLHHKYFEVNYADGLIPFDQWFGTWHDGTKAGEEAMNARWRKKMERENARKARQGENA
ncbi:sterol desaturase family protein [Sinorhizobium sp. BG8]|uniref:sterol desaturase family protein n=1 Tax=Sinorhizobium sp. BG8 TaxID=2613773 RepID=UPI00193CADAB|nr:sterol desaturase family protein [Sinorhizobium sp. BG8]QRM55863.1 sterol desaturase family protein [Sinorhizobium sp. BG8]